MFDYRMYNLLVGHDVNETMGRESERRIRSEIL